MQINISEVKRFNHKSIAIDETIEFDAANVLRNPTVTGAEPFALNGKVYSLDGKLWIHFTYEGMVHFVCDRCVEPFDKLISGEVQREISDTDGFDVEWLVVRDSLIDLTEALTDDIVISLPIQMVCSEDCKGLCHTCGINLNNSLDPNGCSCSREKIDPRLEGLKNFFK